MEWVNVEDSLPPDMLDVLVVYRELSGRAIGVAWRDAEGWQSYEDVVYPETVTHWQKLPPLPEKSE